ncbi:MAG: BBP7 family outer membrane beta-barrel protein [Pirellulaceae bacterium]|nr:BBP7 family outer membrane beta-barrel protein [Pirellulaceae bacterium]
MDRSLRLTIAVSLAVQLLLAAGGAPIRAADADPGLRLVVGGVLQRVTESGQVRYQLVDDQGTAAYEVSSRGSLELANFLGDRVEVVGTLHGKARGELREIRAARVARTDKVVPAHFIQAGDDSPRTATRLVADQRPAAADTPQLQPIPLDAPPPDFPDLPEFQDLPPLTDPLINEEGGVILQAPDATIAPDGFDVYQSPAEMGSGCGPKHRIWGQFELLYWLTDGTRLPPLVTGSDPGTPQLDAGVLGLPTTQILFGDRDQFDSSRGGSRWVLGGWFEPQRRLGMQFDIIDLSDEGFSYRAESNGVDILARPFTNVDRALGPAQGPDAELISYPNVIAGSVAVDGENEFCSFGIHVRGNILFRNGCFYNPGEPCVGSPSGYRLDLLGGYRYLTLEDALAIRGLTTVSVTPQAGFDVLDQFTADNNFQGGELGLLYHYYRNRWTFDGDLKFALGRTEQRVTIAGSTVFSMVGVENEFDGGLLALPTNEGQYTQRNTDFVSELGLTFGYLLTSNLRITGGYRVIYWPRVVRVGNVIDSTVNGSYIPDPTVIPSGPLRPAFAFQDTSFWAQGLSLGLDYRW